MKRKYIDGTYWKSLASCSSKYIHIDDIFCGYISLIKVKNIYQRVTVDYEKSDLCLIDDIFFQKRFEIFRPLGGVTRLFSIHETRSFAG